MKVQVGIRYSSLKKIGKQNTEKNYILEFIYNKVSSLASS